MMIRHLGLSGRDVEGAAEMGTDRFERGRHAANPNGSDSARVEQIARLALSCYLKKESRARSLRQFASFCVAPHYPCLGRLHCLRTIFYVAGREKPVFDNLASPGPIYTLNVGRYLQSQLLRVRDRGDNVTRIAFFCLQ